MCLANPQTPIKAPGDGHGDNLANQPGRRARAIDVIPELLLLVQEFLIAGPFARSQQ
jgi:hypothetical protein